MVERMVAVSFARRRRPPRPPHEPRGADAEHDGARDGSKTGRRECVGAEERHRDRVLDGGCARHAAQRERRAAEENCARDEALGRVRGPEQRHRNGIRRKHDDEHRDAAVGEDAARQDDGEERLLGAEPRHDPAGDGRRRARVAHQPAEDRAEQEERKVLRHEAAEARHEDLGVRGEQPRVAARDHGEEREDRREDQYGDPAVGEVHQEREREENAEDANHRRRRMS